MTVSGDDAQAICQKSFLLFSAAGNDVFVSLENMKDERKLHLSIYCYF